MGIKSRYNIAVRTRQEGTRPAGLGWVVSLALGFSIAGAALAHGPAGHSAPKSVSQTQTDWGIGGDAQKVSRTIRIVMTDDMRFTPNTIVVKLGETVRFEVVNSGKVMHEMVIGTQKELDAHAAMMLKHPNMEHDEPYMAHVSPGGTESLVWQFNRPGNFHFACLIAGHYQAGMTGRITVSKTKALGEASMLIASAPQATVTDAGLSDDWTIAEIRRVDIPNKRMTLKHGEIKGLDMPPMTMVFYVDDTALLQGLKQGDTVRVRVRLDGKRYVVTQIEPQ
jgi:uncharacterized cupredoxin-like copper-binding protein